MFDTGLPEPEALSRADDATVVAAIEEWARAEAAAGARRFMRSPSWCVDALVTTSRHTGRVTIGTPQRPKSLQH